MPRLLPPFALSLLVLAVSGACAPMPPAATAPPAACNADGARDAIGQAPSPDVVERARVGSGSASVRVLQPGQPATMDFRADRLNLDVNERGAITGARCG